MAPSDEAPAADPAEPAHAADRTAERLLAKLRAFSDGLSSDERALLGALLAPGVAVALHDDQEVEGFDMVAWRPAALPEALTRALVARGTRIVEL